jgi:hypothetical protein
VAKWSKDKSIAYYSGSMI